MERSGPLFVDFPTANSTPPIVSLLQRNVRSLEVIPLFIQAIFNGVLSTMQQGCRLTCNVDLSAAMHSPDPSPGSEIHTPSCDWWTRNNSEQITAPNGKKSVAQTEDFPMCDD